MLLPAIENGYFFLALVGVLSSIVSAYYYLRVIKVMYFDPELPAFDPRPMGLSVVLAGSGLFTAFFFLFPAPLIAAARAAVQSLLG